MINEKQFFDSVSQFRVGKSAMGMAEEVKPPPVEEQDPNLAAPQPTQVAGIGNRLKGLLSKSSKAIHDSKVSSAQTPEGMSLEQAQMLVEGFTYSKNSGRPIDENNLGQILNNVETSEDLMRLVDIAGTAEEKFTKQTFEEIEIDSDVFKDLAPVLKGKQQGLLTAKQQYGLRTLLSTAGERAVVLAKKIADGDHTAETLLEYQQTFTAFDSLYRMARGNARETARALNQQKMLAKTMGNKSLREMKAALEIFGSTPEGEGIINSAKVVATRSEKGETGIKALTYNLDKKLNLYTRGAVELWKNNILSGLGTHTTNLSSVAIANLWENFVIRPAAAGIGKARSSITGNLDRVTMSEIAYQQAGAFVGFRSSFGMFKDAFTTNVSQFGAVQKAEHTGAIQQIMGGSKVGQSVADAATISFRLLQAEDDAMRGIVFTSELYALAAREGRLNGLKGRDLLEYVNKTIDDPSDEIYDASLAAAARKTFTQGDLKGAVGAMAKYTRAMTGQVPALQFIMPFVNTPANLLQYGMDTSIMAAVSPRLWKEVQEGGAKADMALAKISVGTSLTMGIWQMYEAGLISGNGPEDFSKRDQLEKEGWKPNAIKGPDGKWYQIKRLEPFSTSVAFLANAFDKAKYAADEATAKEAMAHVMLSFAETAMDSAWTAGIYDFYESMQNPKKWGQFISNFGASFVPYSAAVRTLEQVQDPVSARVSNDPRVNKGWIELTSERIQANTPFMSQSLRPSRYWDGTVKVPDQGGFAFALSPVKTGTVGKGDIVNRELIRNGVSSPEPKPIVRSGYTSFSLLDITGGDDYLYDAYIVEVGKARRELLDKVVSHRQYQKMSDGPNGERFAILQRAMSSAGRLGLKNFMDNVLLAALDKDEILYTRAEQTFLADPKDFIRSLSDEMAGQELNLHLKQIFNPSREPIELPSDQSYVPRF